MINNFIKTVENHMNQGHFTHVYASCGFLIDQKVVYEQCFGDTSKKIYDLASVTKAVVTTPLLFLACEDFDLTFDQTVEEWLKKGKITNDQFKKLPAPIRKITVRQLMRHESGLMPWLNFWINRVDENYIFQGDRTEHILSVLNRVGRLFKADTLFEYSDVGFILLGFIIESIYKSTIDQLFEEKIKIPILKNQTDIQDLCFSLGLNVEKNIIPTGFCNIRNREICGEVHDENCFSLGSVSGHAGLFSSGQTFTEFLLGFFVNKIGNNVVLENLACVKPGEDPLIGWRQGSGPSANSFANGLSIGHLGFTGTGFWINPQDLSFIVLFSNRTYSGRYAPWMPKFRNESLSMLSNLLK